jgi:hypothetical protein
MELAMMIAPIRRLALVAALIAATGTARAADPPVAPPRTYAVVSLIGDQFSVVSRRPDVGTRLDPNERTSLPVPDAVFDRIAAAAVEKALLDAWPGTPVLRASIRDPRLFALQDKLFAESVESHDMRVALHDLLAKAGATDLILVTKQRGEPAFKVTDGMIAGAGSISGIGFYIDNVTRMYNTEHRMTGEGFLAPYAYLAVSLLDMASMSVVKSKHGLQTTMALPQDKEPAAHAWDAMSAKEKVEALEYVIRKAVATGMSGVLAK